MKFFGLSFIFCGVLSLISCYLQRADFHLSSTRCSEALLFLTVGYLFLEKGKTK